MTLTLSNPHSLIRQHLLSHDLFAIRGSSPRDHVVKGCLWWIGSFRWFDVAHIAKENKQHIHPLRALITRSTCGAITTLR
jgi:hypothetical protein